MDSDQQLHPLNIEPTVFAYSCREGFELTVANRDDACFDLRSTEDILFHTMTHTRGTEDGPLYIPPMLRATVGTSIHLQLEAGWEGQIRGRSGLANKGLMVHPGTVDPGYRGELRVILFYLGSNELQIKTGDRIAQLAIRPIFPHVMDLVEVVLDNTMRGTRGLGSSGVR